MKISLYFLIIPFLLMTVHCMSQNKRPAALTTIITADSLASGNLKDVLISFYQVVARNITGAKKEINFTSNPYALMLKTNPNLAVDSSYRKYRALRKLNIGVGVALDDSYKFNGFSAGVKYALINNRDSSTSRWLLESAIQEDSEYTTLNRALRQYAIDSLSDSTKRIFINKVSILFNSRTKTFDQFDSDFQSIIRRIVANKNLTKLKTLLSIPRVNIYTTEHESFASLKRQLQNKFLWTIGVSDTSSKDQLLFTNVLFSTEALKGILNPLAATNLELDLKASYNLVNDSTLPGKNLRRGLFRFEPGINWVIKNKTNQLSFLEIKFSGEYNYIANGLYLNEKQSRLNFNGTIRVRITHDFWIPLQFKYDPVAGNVLGFLNVTANFTGLGKK